MRCDDLEPLMEAIADGSFEPEADDRAHLATCAVCGPRLATARSIDQLLSAREVAAPSPTFANAVMARVGQERWKTERVIDIGFNLAMAAGVLIILAGATGVAWSLGFLNITIDLDAVWQAFGSELTGRFLSQVQTIVLAAILLTMALVLWWWAETASD